MLLGMIVSVQAGRKWDLVDTGASPLREGAECGVG